MAEKQGSNPSLSAIDYPDDLSGGWYPHLDRMPLTVVKKWNSTIVLLNAIDGHTRHAAVAHLVHGDVIDGLPVPVMYLERLPIRREARRETQFVYFKSKPKE
jgi:hypothetical protein